MGSCMDSPGKENGKNIRAGDWDIRRKKLNLIHLLRGNRRCASQIVTICLSSTLIGSLPAFPSKFLYLPLFVFASVVKRAYLADSRTALPNIFG